MLRFVNWFFYTNIWYDIYDMILLMYSTI